MRGYFDSRKKFVSRLVLLSKQRSQRIDRKIVGQWCWKFCNPIDWCIDIWKVVLLTKRTLWSRSLQTLKSPFFSYSDPLFSFREEDITGGLIQSVWHCSRMRQAANITRYDLWTKRVKTNFKSIYFSSILTRTSRELLWATTDSKSNKLITKQTNATGANSGKTPALIFWKCGLHVVTQNGRNRHIALENSLYISRAM